MEAFILLELEGTTNGSMKPRIPNVAVEITRGLWLALVWDEMFAKICHIIEPIKVGRTVMFCSKSEYNVYTKTTG